MSGDSTWMNRPSERLDEFDAQCERAEAGTLPTLADAMRERCPTCRGDLSLAQYGTAGRDWCHRCEPQFAPPPTRCACGEVAAAWIYNAAGGPLPLCAAHLLSYTPASQPA